MILLFSILKTKQIFRKADAVLNLENRLYICEKTFSSFFNDIQSRLLIVFLLLNQSFPWCNALKKMLLKMQRQSDYSSLQFLLNKIHKEKNEEASPKIEIANKRFIFWLFEIVCVCVCVFRYGLRAFLCAIQSQMFMYS